VRLTQAPKVWDEHAHYTLTGKKIIWMSSKGLPMKTNPFQLKTEFWVMDRNGKKLIVLLIYGEPNSRQRDKGMNVMMEF
jgi:hypothetical protein